MKRDSLINFKIVKNIFTLKRINYVVLIIVLSFFMFACNKKINDKQVLNGIVATESDIISSENLKIVDDKKVEYINYNLANEIKNAKIVSDYDDNTKVDGYDTVFYGYFNQDGDLSNGFENVEWIVLEKDDNKALLMSKYILDYDSFGEKPLEIFEDYKVNSRTIIKGPTFILSANDMLKYFCKQKFKNNINIVEIPKKYCEEGEDKDEILKPYYENINSQIAFDKVKTVSTDFVKFKKRYADDDSFDNYFTSTKTIVCDYIQGHTDYATIVGNDKMEDFEYFYHYSNTGGVFGGSTNDNIYKGCGVRPCIYIDLGLFKDTSNNIVFAKAKTKNQGNYPTGHLDNRLNRGAHNKDIDIVSNKYEIIKEEKCKYNIPEIDKVKTINKNYGNIYVDYVDTVLFGEYNKEFDFNEVKKDKLEWVVLTKNEKEAVLLSKNILFPKSFNDEYENVKFLDSSLCKYLNTEFIKEAFTNEEQKKLKTINCDNVGIKVSLLSEDDINKYFDGKNKALSTYGTKYAYDLGLKRYNFNNAWIDLSQNYWIIDKADEAGKNKYVKNDGTISYKGAFVDTKNIGVRPIIKIKLSNDTDDTTVNYEKYLKTNKVDNEKINTINIEDNRKILFGEYNQDGNEKNGKEPIEWQILDKDDKTTLLISKNILDAKEFDDKKIITTWENSSLRKWLNEEFYNIAFDEKQKSAIEKSNVINYDTPFDYANSGNNTVDKVFIPGIDEYRKYLYAKDISKSKITKSIADDENLPKRVYDTYDLNNYWLRTQDKTENETVGSLPTLDALYVALPDIYPDKNYTNLVVDGNGDISSLNYYFEAWTGNRGAIYDNKKVISNTYFCGVRPMIRIKNEFVENYVSKDTKELNYVCDREIGKTYNIDEVLKAKTVKEYSEKERIDAFDTIKFGKHKFSDSISIKNYLDENDVKNNTRDIEWIVLDKNLKEGKILLLSKYNLMSCGAPDNYFSSDFRNVLNNEFINNSFTEEEKKYLLTTDLTNDLIKLDEIKAKIFLLMTNGIDEYFDRSERKLATTYIDQNAKFSTSPYFVMSIKEEDMPDITFGDSMNYVNSLGVIDYTTFGDTCGVRPCMWVKVDKNMPDTNEVVKEVKYNDNDSFSIKISKIEELAKSEENNIDKIDTIKFGKFIQNEERDYKKYEYKAYDEYNNNYCKYDKENIKNWDDIEWFVVKKESDKVLLMSKNILYSVLSPKERYYEKERMNEKNDEKYEIGEKYSENDLETWNKEVSDWLNNEFYNDAFNHDEKTKILETNILTDNDSIKSQIFILSLDEIKEYLPFYENINYNNNVDLYIPRNTSRATKWVNSIHRQYSSGRKTIEMADDIYRYGYGKSPFAIRDSDLCVYCNGDISDYRYVRIVGLRPCMWVSLE